MSCHTTKTKIIPFVICFAYYYRFLKSENNRCNVNPHTLQTTNIITQNPNGHFFLSILLHHLSVTQILSFNFNFLQPNTMQETIAVNVSDNPTPPPPPPPPPTNNRRPRTREVSSRFMTPSASTTQRRQQRDDSDDENSESSFPIGYSFQKKQLQQRAIKLFKESTNNRVFENTPNPNPNFHSHHPPKSTTSRIDRINSTSTPCASRPDTPTISVSSRYRHTPNHHQQHHRSISNSRSSAATKLVQSSVNSLSRGNSISSNSHSHDDIGISCSTQSLPELRSESDSDREVLKQQQSNVNNGSVAEKIGNNNLSRSVSLSSSGIDHLLVRGSERQHASVSKPPVAPQFAKPVVDTRKGKKGSSHQEDVHSLRMFYNRYLQWRFANARAVNAMKVQQKECEVCCLDFITWLLTSSNCIVVVLSLTHLYSRLKMP